MSFKMLPVIKTYARHYAYRALDYAGRIKNRLSKKPENAALPCALPIKSVGKIGGYEVTPYQTMGVTATIASIWLIGRTARTQGLSPWRARLTMLAGAMAGWAGSKALAAARVIYYEGYETYVDFTNNHPDKIGNEWFGGLIGGVLFMSLLSKFIFPKTVQKSELREKLNNLPEKNLEQVLKSLFKKPEEETLVLKSKLKLRLRFILKRLEKEGAINQEQKIILRSIIKQAFKSTFRRFLDALAPAGLLWHGLARIGCFLNGCCYGVETDSILGVSYHGVSRHPTQLYMAIPDLAMAIFLAKWGPRFKKYDGQLLLIALTSHSLTRFGVEFLREHPELPERLNETLLNLYQIPSLSLFILSGGLLFINYLRGRFSKNS
jgi:prolipoprotein diacylglyceryltransferase